MNKLPDVKPGFRDFLAFPFIMTALILETIGMVIGGVATAMLVASKNRQE